MNTGCGRQLVTLQICPLMLALLSALNISSSVSVLKTFTHEYSYSLVVPSDEEYELLNSTWTKALCAAHA